MDGSGSICVNDPTREPLDEPTSCANWGLVRDFMGAFIGELDIGSDRTRVALVVFDNDARVEFDLTR